MPEFAGDFSRPLGVDSRARGRQGPRVAVSASFRKAARESVAKVTAEGATAPGISQA